MPLETKTPRRVGCSVAGITGLVCVGLLVPPANEHATAQTPDYIDWMPAPDTAPSLARVHGVDALDVLPLESAYRGLVEYEAFSGRHFTLHRYDGRHIALLVPDQLLVPNQSQLYLSLSELWILLDRSDVLYQHHLELVGQPPRGTGLTSFAFVPFFEDDGCPPIANACGYRGAKGMEKNLLTLPSHDPFLDPERLVKNFSVDHELTHNFEPAGGHLSYISDHAHAWQGFAEAYAAAVYRRNRPDLLRDNLIRRWRSRFTGSASWLRCVVEDACEIPPKLSWSGFTTLLATFHGVPATQRALRQLPVIASQERPTTPQEKEEVYLRSWADGSGLNLGCYIDAWNWTASPALRSSWDATYDPNVPACADSDNDGFRGWSDCNDQNPAVYPEAEEVLDGEDNDCNGAVDDVALEEPEGDDFPQDLPIALPVTIVGEVGPGDQDHFVFDVSSPPFSLQIISCSDPDIEVLSVDPDDTLPCTGSDCAVNYSINTCEKLFDASSATGLWRLLVKTRPGTTVRQTYRISLSEATTAEAAEDLGDFSSWGSTEEPVVSDRIVRLRTNVDDPRDATHVRYWFAGQGFVGSSRSSKNSWLDWELSNPLPDGTYGYRAQLVNGGLPASDVTPLRFFSVGGACGAGDETLCLNRDRFKVQVLWWDGRGRSGVGRATPLTDESGYFWFFTDGNVELVLKVLDGRHINGHYWIFFAGLSDVAYHVVVRDTVTGVVRSYDKEAGRLESFADTTAFAVPAASRSPDRGLRTPASAQGSSCSVSDALCVREGRFSVNVVWESASGTRTSAHPVALSEDTGYFWFFTEDNVEIIVKILDGTQLNDHFWVFYAAMSDVAYEIVVTDLVTGAEKTYVNRQGELSSVADTSAFAAKP